MRIFSLRLLKKHLQLSFSIQFQIPYSTDILIPMYGWYLHTAMLFYDYYTGMGENRAKLIRASREPGSRKNNVSPYKNHPLIYWHFYVWIYKWFNVVPTIYQMLLGSGFCYFFIRSTEYKLIFVLWWEFHCYSSYQINNMYCSHYQDHTIQLKKLKFK